MAIPNLGNLVLHAAGFVNGFTPAIVSGSNLASVTKDQVGQWSVFYGSEIQDGQAVVIAVPTFIGVGTVPIMVPLFNTPEPRVDRAVVQAYSSVDGSTLIDVAFQITILRTTLP